MAAFCLRKEFVDKFLQGLREGAIDPGKMADMSSADRRAYLSKFVGEDSAKEVNALFESKLLLKNKQQGYITWAKKVAGITPEVRRDIISRIEKLQNVLDPKEEQQFLQDLASQRLRIDISPEEAKTLADLSKKNAESKAVWEEKLQEGLKKNPDFVTKELWKKSPARWQYGYDQVNLENYFNELKLNSRKISFKENPSKFIGEAIKNTPGIMKSLVATLDNSFFGRQGVKTLYTHPTVWMRSFLTSWKDLAKQTFSKGEWYKAGDDAVLDSIKADIYSRPNAINGKYKVGGFGLDVLSEEAFPTSIPERIPLLGRLFKASEVAYNGAALRMRADLADMLIKKAEDNGLNMLNPEDAKGVGSLVSSLTGRGSLGVLEPASGKINVLLFSVKFFKSNFDTLTAHLFDSKASGFVKKEAALNLLKIVGTIGTVLTIAKLINPNSVDEDPRSTNFGKIKIFGEWTDITGGMGSLVTLAARLVPTMHDGKLSLWQKSSSGKFTDLLGGQYGQQDAYDLLINTLFSNKLSPTAGILRDIWKGKNFQGQKPTLLNQLYSTTIPLSIQQMQSFMSDPSSSFALGSLILDGLGFSTNTLNTSKDWSQNPTAAQQAFLNKVGQDKFTKANNEFNTAYNKWFNKTTQSYTFKKLSDGAQQALETNAKEKIQTQVFKKYGFVYKKPKQTQQQKNESTVVKRLLPR